MTPPKRIYVLVGRPSPLWRWQTPSLTRSIPEYWFVTPIGAVRSAIASSQAVGCVFDPIGWLVVAADFEDHDADGVARFRFNWGETFEPFWLLRGPR